MVFVAEGMWEAGTDGMDFDTAGAAGDGDFLATLTRHREDQGPLPRHRHRAGHGQRVRARHARRARPTRAGGSPACGPRSSSRSRQEAGATMFGPAVNVNTTKSVAWNVARACTIIKPCMDVAEIPVHPNVGMGVGGVPMSPYPPADAVSRVSRALVDILRLRRVVGGRRRPARHGVHARAGLGHGRDADRRRSGGPHADDPGHAPQGSQDLRGRQARRAPSPTSPTPSSCTTCAATSASAGSRCRSSRTPRTPAPWRRSSASPRCSTCPSTASRASGALAA